MQLVILSVTQPFSHDQAKTMHSYIQSKITCLSMPRQRMSIKGVTRPLPMMPIRNLHVLMVHALMGSTLVREASIVLQLMRVHGYGVN